MFGSASRLQSLKGATSITVAGAAVKLSQSIKSLSVTMDENLTFDRHDGNGCKASYYHIRGLRHIRAALSKDTDCTVASANRRFKIGWLQRPFGWNLRGQSLQIAACVQNTLARVIMGTRRRDHISPVLADLHWLPVSAKITYKIATLVYKIREVKQPMYLAELIENYKPVRGLRSTSGCC